LTKKFAIKLDISLFKKVTGLYECRINTEDTMGLNQYSTICLSL